MHRPPTPSWTRTSLCVSAALAVAIGTSAGAALAATTVVDTGVDTYISSEFPDACYGDPTEPYACSAAPGDGIFGVKWDTSAGAGAEHGLLWFDISPALLSQFLATPGATATLQYNVFDTSTSPPGALHRMTVDWLTLGGSSGDAITWNTIGCSSDGGGVDVSGVCTTAEPTSNASAPAGSTGLFQVDVTADVLAWAGGAANYGWGFRPLGGSGAGIDSFENGVTPTLTLTLPEPVTILRYEFNETGNAPGSSGEDRRPVKMRDDAGTPLDSHTANAGGVSGLPGDRAFANTGADDHGSTASAGANGFRADQAANPALEGLSAFTVSGWFRTEDNTSVNGKTPRLVSNHDGQGFNVQFLSGSEGDLKLEVDDDTAEAASTGAPYDAKQTWVFFAVSYDGTASTDNVNFYIGYRDDTEAGGGPGSADVALVNTATLDRGPVDAGAGALAIGNRAAGDRPFDGFLDDIRIDDFAADGASGLATLEAYRQASLVGPLDMSFSYVDSTTVSAQVLNQSSNPVTVHELSGVAWVPGSITFEAISDDTPSAILNIDVTSGGVFLPFAATAVSATSLADNRDFEGIVFTDPTRNSVFVSEEGVPEIREYNRTTGALLQVLPVPSVFTNRRANRGFESLGRRRDGSEMITGVEQALTVDGPAGTSTTVGTVVRLLRYDVVGNVATPAEQYAYVVEPAHSTPVGDGSSLSDVIVLDNGDLLTVERSDAGGEFLVRVFYTSLAGATDVSLGSLGSGLIGETYTPASKTLLYSSDALDKMEGLALGWEYANGDNLVIGVEDESLTTNVIHAFFLNGDLPTAVCGDSAVTGGEQCDEGAANGTPGQCCSASCTFEPVTTECRASGGVCDAPEFCDGASVVCPADGKLVTECRASAGICDVAESCDGVADDCPVDGFEPVSTECRPSAGVCDAADFCDGGSASCTADAKLVSECRAAAGICDVAESCDGVADACPVDGFEPNGTSCNDADVCNGMEICMSGACDTGTALDCDDQDVCTADSCDAVTGCGHAPIPDCVPPVPQVPSGTAASHAMVGMLLLAVAWWIAGRRGRRLGA